MLVSDTATKTTSQHSRAVFVVVFVVVDYLVALVGGSGGVGRSVSRPVRRRGVCRRVVARRGRRGRQGGYCCRQLEGERSNVRETLLQRGIGDAIISHVSL